VSTNCDIIFVSIQDLVWILSKWTIAHDLSV